jgi:hypothetical protein
VREFEAMEADLHSRTRLCRACAGWHDQHFRLPSGPQAA